MVEGLGVVLALIAICWIVLGLAAVSTARGKDAFASLSLGVLLLGGGFVCWKLAMWLTDW